MGPADLHKAWAAWRVARGLCDEIVKGLAQATEVDGRVSVARLDEHQVRAYLLAVNLSGLEGVRAALEHAERVGCEASTELACLALVDLIGRFDRDFGMASDLDVRGLRGAEVTSFVAGVEVSARWHAVVEALQPGMPGATRGLSDEQDMIRSEFRKFAEAQVVPVAEHVHREDALIPREILDALSELGCFGLSIPETYGGLQPDGEPDNLNMCLVTEELSRGSLGVAGSLITRPEILSKALLKGGTEAQKQFWLPRLATAETLCAVAVTEPDFGSDVAGMKVTATVTEGGWLLNGQKTWCTFAGFADVMMVLARTNPDPTVGHRGLSILLAEKPRFEGHEFDHTQPGGGRVTAERR